MPLSMDDINAKLDALEVMMQLIYVEHFRGRPAKAKEDALANWKAIGIQTFEDRAGEADDDAEAEQMELAAAYFAAIMDQIKVGVDQTRG